MDPNTILKHANQTNNACGFKIQAKLPVGKAKSYITAKFSLATTVAIYSGMLALFSIEFLLFTSRTSYPCVRLVLRL